MIVVAASSSVVYFPSSFLIVEESETELQSLLRLLAIMCVANGNETLCLKRAGSERRERGQRWKEGGAGTNWPLRVLFVLESTNISSQFCTVVLEATNKPTFQKRNPQTVSIFVHIHIHHQETGNCIYTINTLFVSEHQTHFLR